MRHGGPGFLLVFAALAAWASPAFQAPASGPIVMAERAAELNVAGIFGPNSAVGGTWMGGGGAVVDFNKNGLPDLFVITGGTGGALDRLFINQGDGTFQDEAIAWGLTKVHVGNGAAAADFNSNGFIDVYVTSFGNLEDGALTPGRNKLYHNNGDNTFTNVADIAGVAWVHPSQPAGFGANWGDYNLNGHLDLYVACQWPSGPRPDVLFHNNGDGTFTNVTIAAGVYDPSVWGFQGAFADMNENGWPDLLVAADFFTSRYFRNNGNGTFTNITAASGTGLDANGMGQAIADVNNSGLLDWYVTSIYPTIHAPLDGNMLYINQGHHQYFEVAKTVGVHDGAWGWGALAIDLDHKGWVDLIEVNGRPAPGTLWYEVPPKLFYNNGDGTFTEIGFQSGMTHGDEGRGMVRLDANRDGRQDVLVFNFGQQRRFYRNETPNVGNWIGISFDTSNNPLLPPNGFGARVVVEAGGSSYLRYMHGDPSYLSTSELNVHFGVADAPIIDTITIKWPRGYVTTLENVPVNQYIEIAAPALADFNHDGVVNIFDLLLVLSKWGPVTSGHELLVDVNNDGMVNIFDLLFVLSSWGPT